LRELRRKRDPDSDLCVVATFPRRVGVRAIDNAGLQIPGVEFEWFVNDVLAGNVFTNGQASLDLPDDSATVSVKAKYGGLEQGPIKLALDQTH
jgi:hypothetical protein